MGFLFFLGIPSCKAESVKETNHGRFIIRHIVLTEKEKGTVLKRKYETNSYIIKYEILYNGKKIKFPAPLQKSTPYNFPWRVFILKGYENPALIAASENSFLLIDEPGGVKVQQLNHSSSRSSSFQWLDNSNQQPGTEIVVHGPLDDHWLDSSLAVQAEGLLLVNRESLFDLRASIVHRFNKNNIVEYRGWRMVLDGPGPSQGAIGFSDKFHQVAFRALRLDEKIEGNYQSGILSFNYLTDSITISPFSRTGIRLSSLDELTPEYFRKCFSWDDDGNLHLHKDFVPPAWHGKLNFQDKNFINYSLFPVREPMLDIFLSGIKHHFSHRITAVERMSDSIQHVYDIGIGKDSFQLSYFKKELKLIFELHFNQDYSGQNRDIIVEAGEYFNRQLLTKQLDKYFASFNE